MLLTLKTYLCFRTIFGVITAQCNKLFANRAPAVCFPLAHFRVVDNATHLLTAWQSTVSIPTLTSMHQRLYAPLKNTQLKLIHKYTFTRNQKAFGSTGLYIFKNKVISVSKHIKLFLECQIYLIPIYKLLNLHNY